MGPREIGDFTIGLLAQEAKCSPGEMRQRLEVAGGDLPIDSILLVEVVVRVEERYGVHLATTLDTVFNLRSVSGFAVMVNSLVQVERARQAGEIA
jgi:acyl carrier protein